MDIYEDTYIYFFYFISIKNLSGTGVTKFDNAKKTDEDDNPSFRRSSKKIKQKINNSYLYIEKIRKNANS